MTDRQHAKTNPECPSPTHGNATAARREPKCICAAGLAALEAYKAAEADRRRGDYADGRRGPYDVVRATDFEAPAVPEIPEHGAVARRVQRGRGAACAPGGGVDPELFFPVSEDVTQPAIRSQVRQAKAVCRRCPVVDSCLTWGLQRIEIEGVLGGLTHGERIKLRRIRLAGRAS